MGGGVLPFEKVWFTMLIHPNPHLCWTPPKCKTLSGGDIIKWLFFFFFLSLQKQRGGASVLLTQHRNGNGGNGSSLSTQSDKMILSKENRVTKITKQLINKVYHKGVWLFTTHGYVCQALEITTTLNSTVTLCVTQQEHHWISFSRQRVKYWQLPKRNFMVIEKFSKFYKIQGIFLSRINKQNLKENR